VYLSDDSRVPPGTPDAMKSATTSAAGTSTGLRTMTEPARVKPGRPLGPSTKGDESDGG
ncbi:hypothetical protein BHM03_00059372, partial [Ensete ventricosum]